MAKKQQSMRPAAIAERQRAVEGLILAGKAEREIARLLGLHQTTVGQIRRRLGLPPPGRWRKPLTAEELRAVEALLADGASYGEAARTVGRGPVTIARHFPGRGWDHEAVADFNRARALLDPEGEFR